MSVERKIKNFLDKLTDEEIKELELGQVLSFELNNNYFTFFGSLTNEEPEVEEGPKGLAAMTKKDVNRLKAIESQLLGMESQTFEGILFGPLKLICEVWIEINPYSELDWYIDEYRSRIVLVNDDFVNSSSFGSKVKGYVSGHLTDINLCGEEFDLIETSPEYKEFEEKTTNLCREFTDICRRYDESVEDIWDEL